MEILKSLEILKSNIVMNLIELKLYIDILHVP